VIATTSTTKGYDVVLVVHALLALTTLVVLFVLRAAAASVARGELAPGATRSFSGRREVAGRVLHLVPLSGLALVGLSRGAYGLATGFVVVGLCGWVVAACSLEAVAFPAQRRVAAGLRDGTAATASDARVMLRALEVAALTVVVAAVVMVVAPS
jgi:hypothetical protein